MPAGRRSQDLIGRRRRGAGDSDGEEEEGILGADDSQSEASVATGAEGHETTHGSLADEQASEVGVGKTKDQDPANGAAHIAQTQGQDAHSKSPSSSAANQMSAFATPADTQTMLNGAADATSGEKDQVADFSEQSIGEDSKAFTKAAGTSDRRRREQEQQRPKRDADPTFIPSRGNFFMHDARASDQRGYAGPARGRGRGRGFASGPLAASSYGYGQASRLADAQWTHDLHEAINEPEQKPLQNTHMSSRPLQSYQNPAAAARAAPAPEYRPYSFSNSKLLGKVQIRVCLPSMDAPALFAGIPVKQHTLLPDHRPPLRRDKPVRISIPDRSPSYIFPSQERSFIFIPRAMRPNQQGMGRNRLGSSSRRTSIYGGSVYSPSVSLSRRSSIAREIGREFMFSPAGSVVARQMSAARPVVRLPQGMSQPPSIASPVGSITAQMPGFPLPQTPAIEHYRETGMMHQPRPQKTISVSGIDSPAALSLHAPRQQDQQPFENQLPHHMADSSIGSSINADVLQPSYYAYQGQTGTPLSHIPERAIHAQPFQPPSQSYGQSYYGQYSQPGYYYQPVPMYMAQGTPRQVAAQPASSEQDNAAQASMMAHESNGMVYYIDPSQMQSYSQQGGYTGQEGYMGTGQGYTMPGMVNASGDGSGWYYPAVSTGTMFYPQQ